MNTTTKSIAMMVEVMLSLLVASTNLSAQATVDVENKFPNVGALMVWLVDESGNPTRLLGFASGTLISDRVMVTAGHFTAPATALGKMPPNIRIFASFSATNARDPKTWIPVIRQATHPSMPFCPPPPKCDPTDEILVAPLQPGIADVGLVLLEHAPSGIKAVTLASPTSLKQIAGSQMTIVGYGTTKPALGDTSIWDGKRRVRASKLKAVADETWAIWSLPSYVCSGDSGGAIFIDQQVHKKKGKRLIANVSDGGRDCRSHNNNNRLDTVSVQVWIRDTIKQMVKD